MDHRRYPSRDAVDREALLNKMLGGPHLLEKAPVGDRQVGDHVLELAAEGWVVREHSSIAMPPLLDRFSTSRRYRVSGTRVRGPAGGQDPRASVMHCITDWLCSTSGTWRSRGQRVPTSTGSRTRTQSAPSQTRTTSRSSSTNRDWRARFGRRSTVEPPPQLGVGGHLLEVMVEPIPPRGMHIVHVMHARQEHLDRMEKDSR